MRRMVQRVMRRLGMLRESRPLGLQRPPMIRELLGLSRIVRLPQEGALQRRRHGVDLAIHLQLERIVVRRGESRG